MLNRLSQLLEFGIRPRSAEFRWGFALFAFLFALLLRLEITSALPPGFPYLTFFPAVIVTTFLCGLWPGTAVAVFSGIAAWYFFIAPFGSFSIDGATLLALGFYAAIVTVDILLIHLMQEALIRLRAESARQSRERELSQQLAQSREIMFQELQHRVSNNLQVLGALMTLQRGAVQDEGARRIIDQAATRLELIGRIHRQLHDPSGQRVGFGVFLESLCQDVLQAAGASGIQARVRADPVLLPPEQVVPVALIVVELVSNALEHGFAGCRQGHILVTLDQEEPGNVWLTVRDDGAGLPAGFDPETSQSLGLRIVRALAGQLGAEFRMRPAGPRDPSPRDGTTGGARPQAARGTVCSLFFPVQ